MAGKLRPHQYPMDSIVIGHDGDDPLIVALRGHIVHLPGFKPPRDRKRLIRTRSRASLEAWIVRLAGEEGLDEFYETLGEGE